MRDEATAGDTRVVAIEDLDLFHLRHGSALIGEHETALRFEIYIGQQVTGGAFLERIVDTALLSEVERSIHITQETVDDLLRLRIREAGAERTGERETDDSEQSHCGDCYWHPRDASLGNGEAVSVGNYEHCHRSEQRQCNEHDPVSRGRRHVDERRAGGVREEVPPPQDVVAIGEDVRKRSGLVCGRRRYAWDAVGEEIPCHGDFLWEAVHRIDKDHTHRGLYDVEVLGRFDDAGGPQVAIDKMDAVEQSFDGLAIDGERRPVCQKLHDSLFQCLLILHPDRVRAGQAEVDPRFEILGAKDDFLAHLVRLHIEERRDWRKELAPQVPVVELREPWIRPVEVDRLAPAQVAEVVDR